MAVCVAKQRMPDLSIVNGLDTLWKVSFKQSQRLNNLNPEDAWFGFLSCALRQAWRCCQFWLQRYLHRNWMAWRYVESFDADNVKAPLFWANVRSAKCLISLASGFLIGCTHFCRDRVVWQQGMYSRSITLMSIKEEAKSWSFDSLRTTPPSFA